jgi:hypothetical protein
VSGCWTGRWHWPWQCTQQHWGWFDLPKGQHAVGSDTSRTESIAACSRWPWLTVATTSGDLSLLPLQTTDSENRRQRHSKELSGSALRLFAVWARQRHCRSAASSSRGPQFRPASSPRAAVAQISSKAAANKLVFAILLNDWWGWQSLLEVVRLAPIKVAG